MTTYAEAAASISKTPITLATITLNWPDEQVIRVATTGYTDASGNDYEALIQAAPTITTKVSDPFGGQSSQSMASLGLANTGALDAYREYSWVGASIVVEFGFAEIADADFKTMFTGYISGAADTETTLTLSVQSAAEKLKQTIIPPDEYADMSLPDRVEWVLDLAGVDADTTSWAAWETDNDYTTRFHPTAEMTAEVALKLLLFGSIWGVGTDGKFFVHTVAEADGTADATVDGVEVLSVKRSALGQYYRVSATIPDVDVDSLANLLPSADYGYLLSCDQVQTAIASGWDVVEYGKDSYSTDAMWRLYIKSLRSPMQIYCTRITKDINGDEIGGYWAPSTGNSYSGPTAGEGFSASAGALSKTILIECPYDATIQSVTVYAMDSGGSKTSIQTLDPSDCSIVQTCHHGGNGYCRIYSAPIETTAPSGTVECTADVVLSGHTNTPPYNIDVILPDAVQIDTWGIHASGISSIKLQYWDDTTSAYIDADSRTDETTVCTGGIAWFTLSAVTTATKWRISVITADADCKIYRVKFCDTTQDIESITKELTSVLDANPLAKASSTTQTYIKAISDAEDVIERAMSLRSASRTVTTITTRAMPGLRSIYDVVSLETERIDNALYRVVGITEKLATGETTLELFK